MSILERRCSKNDMNTVRECTSLQYIAQRKYPASLIRLGMDDGPVIESYVLSLRSFNIHTRQRCTRYFIVSCDVLQEMALLFAVNDRTHVKDIMNRFSSFMTHYIMNNGGSICGALLRHDRTKRRT